MRYIIGGAVVALTLALAGCAGSEEPAPSVPSAPAVEQSTPPATPTEPEGTMAQQQAVEKAKQYLASQPFSRKGLIDQLVFEGFSTEDATYGVDALKADWTAQAGAKAQQYLDTQPFSREGLVEQLIFEGFTPEEAEAGVTSVGY